MKQQKLEFHLARLFIYYHPETHTFPKPQAISSSQKHHGTLIGLRFILAVTEV